MGILFMLVGCLIYILIGVFLVKFYNAIHNYYTLPSDDADMALMWPILLIIMFGELVAELGTLAGNFIRKNIKKGD